MVKNKLGNLVNIKTGKLDANASSSDGEYPFFTCSREPLKISSYSYDCKCVLVAGNGDLNVKYYEGKFDAYQRTYIIESKDESILDTRYLYLFLSKYVEKLRELSIGGVIKYIKINNLTDPIIPLPPLKDQKRIVKILDKADTLRQKRKQAVGFLDDYLKSVFLEMFGDPVKNPKNWEKKKLSRIADICSGVTKGRKLDKTKTVFAPYMRVANVQDEYIDLTEVKEIEVLPSDIEKYRLQYGDLLLTEGGDPDKLGRGGVWRGQIENCIHQNHIFRLRLDKKLATPEYISALIGSNYGKRYFLKSAKQTTGIATINSTQLKSFPIVLPTIVLQNKYSKAVKKLEIIKQKMLTQSKALEIQFQALIQKAFKGVL